MAHDFILENQPGASFRVDLNNALQAMVSWSVGAEPTTRYSGQTWWDFSNGLIKIRNYTNTAWVVWAAFDGVTFTPYRAGVALGTAAAANTGTVEGTVPVLAAGGLLPASTLPAAPAGVPVGATIWRQGRDQPAGWLACDGRTIGNTGSGAAVAGDWLEALYLYIWEQSSNAENQVWNETSTPGTPVPVSRNITAEADWLAGRTISLTRCNGRMLIGLDDMGGTAAGVVTSASTDGANALLPGGQGGAQTHSLTAAQNGPHAHTYSAYTQNALGNRSISGSDWLTTSSNTASSGSGAAHNNMPPWVAGTWLIKW